MKMQKTVSPLVLLREHSDLLQKAKDRAQVAANNNEKSVYVYQLDIGAFELRFTPIPPEKIKQEILCAIMEPNYK